MRKGTVIAFVLGWLLAVLIAPRDVIGMVTGRGK